MRMFGAGARRGVAVLVALLLFGGAALAGVLDEKQRGRPQARSHDPGPSEGEMRGVIEQLMIERLKEVLRLTPRQQSQVIPRMQALLEARRDHAAERRAARARLRALLMDDGASEEAIAGAIDEARGIERGFRLKEEGLRDAIDSDLTPRQRGRFLFFEERFRRVVQRRLREAAERRAQSRPGAPERRPARPWADVGQDDLDPEGDQE
jgi:hypothetical protein